MIAGSLVLSEEDFLCVIQKNSKDFNHNKHNHISRNVSALFHKSTGKYSGSM